MGTLQICQHDQNVDWNVDITDFMIASVDCIEFGILTRMLFFFVKFKMKNSVC